MNPGPTRLDLEAIVPSSLDRVVAAEPLDDGNVELYVREGDAVRRVTRPFNPFLLLRDGTLLDGFEEEHRVRPLDDGGSAEPTLAFLAEFDDLRAHDRAVKFLKTKTGKNPSAPNAPYKTISDATMQAMIASGVRLFAGMTLNEIHRMQVDIETLTTDGYEFPNPKRDDDRVIIIAMSDNNGWERRLQLDEDGSEKELLEKFVDIVRSRDPDVIEGHNIFRFDLSFLAERAKRHRVKLEFGRDGGVMKKRSSRFTAAERTINYPRFDIHGRHVIDTFHLTQLYDVVHRDLEGYGLKSVARHFNVAAPDRIYVEGADITKLWTSDRGCLGAYAMDDVRETRAIADILSPSYFYQTRLLPLSYQNCVVRGNATRIDALLTSTYLSMNAALPYPEKDRRFAGGLTKTFATGVFANVWHCDARSLYPSIILAEQMRPSRDHLGAFATILAKLRDFRLRAKDAEKSTPNQAERDHLNSLQTSFKILINSFYGYLGFPYGTFNDFDMAETIAARGRELLTAMVDHIQNAGGDVIEIDTDGVYFQPPPNVTSPEAMEASIQSVLPTGVDVELDAIHPAMFCYKSKNYALLNDNGEVAITGAALKSRGLEPFQRDYIKALITALLNGKPDAITALTKSNRDAIANQKLPLEKLAKTETLNDSPENYAKKLESGKGRRSAAYELALKANRDYRQGDQVSFYVTGEKKNVSVVDNSKLLVDAPPERDENVTYYLAKLDDLRKKFDAFIN